MTFVNFRVLLPLLMLCAASVPAVAYPVDGYGYTGIRRLEYAAAVQAGTAPGRKLLPGQYLPLTAIEPHWKAGDGRRLPAADAELSAGLDALMRGSGYSTYSIALLDLSDPAKPRYAAKAGDERVNVGSVGKIVVALALMQTLADLYPNDLAARERVLRGTKVTADAFSQYDQHTVPFYDPQTKVRVNRKIRIGDSGSLWEYLDWMLSASSNSAAGMVQKELVALKHFGSAYPPPPDQYQAFFAAATPKQLGDLYLSAIDDALTRNGFDPLQFRQASFFTRGGKNRVNGQQSFATANQLLAFLYRMEAGTLVDAFSSRELKRLLYMTQRRIRYASHPVLDDYAVFFKSGSFYQCHSGGCAKYKGDKTNRLASVAMIESPAGAPKLHYLVAVTSNVLRVNSAVAHQTLALRIQRLVERMHPTSLPESPTEGSFATVPVDDPDLPSESENDAP